MKKSRFSLLLLSGIFFFNNSLYPQQRSNAIVYKINFVFSGEVKNFVDSTFLLEYTFDSKDFKKISKIYFEDSNGEKIVKTSSISKELNCDIKDENGKVRILFKNYDKYDIAVPTAIEVEGKIKQLYHLNWEGRLREGKSIVKDLKVKRERGQKE